MQRQWRHKIDGRCEHNLESVETPDGNVIVPVSRVSLGFAAGGTEYEVEEKKEQKGFPFGGGTGGGIAVNPVAFLVVGQGHVRLLPVDGNAVVDRLIDMAPRIVEQIQEMVGSKKGYNNRSNLEI